MIEVLFFTYSREIILEGSKVAGLCIYINIFIICILILPYLVQVCTSPLSSEKMLHIRKGGPNHLHFYLEELLFCLCDSVSELHRSTPENDNSENSLPNAWTQSNLFKSEYIGTWGNITGNHLHWIAFMELIIKWEH